MTPPRSNLAFSLTELLTAILIVSIISLLTIAAVRGIRMQSQAAGCVRNLNQMAIGTIQYAHDHQMYLPGLRWYMQPEAGYQGTITTYFGLTRREAGRNTVLTCPAHQAHFPCRSLYNRTYSLNRYLHSRGMDDALSTESPTRLTQLQAPSRTALFLDGVAGVSYVNDADGYWYASNASPESGGWADDVFYPHSGQLQVAYADGHVGRIDAPEMRRLAQNRDPIFWRSDPGSLPPTP